MYFFRFNLVKNILVIYYNTWLSITQLGVEV